MDEVIEQLVDWTNKYAKQQREDKEQSLWARVWQPICKNELYGYLGVLIYMGLTYKFAIKDY